MLRQGFNSIIRTIEERLHDQSLTQEQKDFLSASLIECHGLLRYAKRHSDFFRHKAAVATDPQEKDNCDRLSAICSKVPVQPADSFQEALQSIWFAQLGTQFDDCANHSLGRMDQYLYPYYRRDIEQGRLTHEEARELFYEFWLKFNLGYKLQELSGTKMGLRAKDDESQGITRGGDFDIYDVRNGLSWLTLKCISQTNHTDDGQTMDVAGLTANRGDATNDLSRLILDAEAELRTFEPKVVVQYTSKTDPAFMQKVYELLSTGFGLPAVSFHDAGTNGLRYYGQFSEVDLLNHSHIGCVELGIPGCSYTDPMNAFINIPKILLITMNNGFCGARRVGLDFSPGRSWDQFIKAFYAQLDYFIGLYASAMNDAGPFYSSYYYRPLVSALVKGCVEKAVPVDRGGSVYWNRAVNCTGFATTVDSLYALKKLVYEENRMSLQDLRQILESDFEGSEDLRQYIRNRIAKFGNGDEEVDHLASELTIEYSKMVRARRTHIGTSYRPGIYSFYEPIKSMGKRTGATPDGRKKGEVLSLNCAPAHGAVKEGLSNVLRSATAIRHSLVDNASCLDIRLSGKTPPAVIKTIVDYLSRRDILFVQLTVVDNQELMEAYEKPNAYQDLVVRVTGYSARFVVLPKDTQEEIIRRSSWN